MTTISLHSAHRLRVPGLLFSLWVALPAQAMATAGATPAVAWWVWPVALFVACFLMGIVAVPAGIGV